MNRKSQVLIIILWILLILTALTVSIGHRVSMALRLSRYQKDSLKALYLAKAGLNRAIVELENDISNPDTKDYDALNETWSNNEEIFKEIRLTDNENEYAQVSYDFGESKNPQTRFGVIDEERKININKVPQELLETLLTRLKVTDSLGIANNIRTWRGDKDVPEDAKDYSTLGYACKNGPFVNVEELLLVKGMTSELYTEIKDLITVYGDEKVNINTASNDVLEILINTCFKKLQGKKREVPDITESDAQGLLGNIVGFRERGGIFENIDLQSYLNLGPEQIGQLTIATDPTDGLQSKILVKSNHFKIESTGNVGQIKKKITAVVKRTVPIKTVYWHES